MLIWVCALHCEAKPVIDFYRLKKSHQDSAFDLYQNDNMACVISGLGKVASAAASAWIAARFQQPATLCWINLGIAGAADTEIGTPCLVNQIIDADNGNRFYPAPVKRPSMAGKPCMTLAQACREYHPEYLYDMEASGFIYSALRFSTAELTQSIKVVSDNEWHDAGKNRQQTSDLIHQNIEAIDGVARYLLNLGDELDELAIDHRLWQELLAAAHFSQTQKKRLQVLLGYLLNRDFDSATISRQLSSQNSAGTIIARLEALSRADSSML